MVIKKGNEFVEQVVFDVLEKVFQIDFDDIVKLKVVLQLVSNYVCMGDGRFVRVMSVEFVFELRLDFVCEFGFEFVFKLFYLVFVNDFFGCMLLLLLCLFDMCVGCMVICSVVFFVFIWIVILIVFGYFVFLMLKVGIENVVSMLISFGFLMFVGIVIVLVLLIIGFGFILVCVQEMCLVVCFMVEVVFWFSELEMMVFQCIMMIG